jgi:hypothetical protein
MDTYHVYIPVLICAVVVFGLLTLNPTWIQGKTLKEKPEDKTPDPLMTSIIVFLIGAVVVWLMESKVLTLGSACYRY